MSSNSRLELKPLIRLNKSSLRSICGKMIPYENKYEKYITCKEDSCKKTSCSFYAAKKKIQEEIEKEKRKETPDVSAITSYLKQLSELNSCCMDTSCPYASEHIRYNNDKKTYHLYEKKYGSKRLPKSAMRVYLLLYSLPMEKLLEQFFIRDIHISLLAEKLHITKATTETALKMLSAFHYITISHASSKNHYNIIINDYELMSKSAKEGNGGYFTIHSDMMDVILSIKNVNSLRLEILSLLKCNETIYKEGVKESSYALADIKKIIPSYINYKNAYYKVLKDRPSTLASFISKEDKRLYFYLLPGNHTKLDVEEYRLEKLKDIEHELKLHDIKLTNLALLNLSELSTNFSVKTIIDSVVYIKEYYDYNNIPIRNYGALVRQLCLRNSRNLSAA